MKKLCGFIGTHRKQALTGDDLLTLLEKFNYSLTSVHHDHLFLFLNFLYPCFVSVGAFPMSDITYSHPHVLVSLLLFGSVLIIGFNQLSQKQVHLHEAGRGGVHACPLWEAGWSYDD